MARKTKAEREALRDEAIAADRKRKQDAYQAWLAEHAMEIDAKSQEFRLQIRKLVHRILMFYQVSAPKEFWLRLSSYRTFCLEINDGRFADSCGMTIEYDVLPLDHEKPEIKLYTRVCHSWSSSCNRNPEQTADFLKCVTEQSKIATSLKELMDEFLPTLQAWSDADKASDSTISVVSHAINQALALESSTVVAANAQLKADHGTT